MGNRKSWQILSEGITMIIFDCYVLAKSMLEENGLSESEWDIEKGIEITIKGRIDMINEGWQEKSKIINRFLPWAVFWIAEDKE